MADYHSIYSQLYFKEYNTVLRADQAGGGRFSDAGHKRKCLWGAQVVDRILSRASLTCAIALFSGGPALAPDASDRHVFSNMGPSERLVRGLESMGFLLTAEDTGRTPRRR